MSGPLPGSRILTIIHFNDVYQLEDGGDAERFAYKVKTYANRMPLVLFSGDCFAPSLLSVTTKGKQMVEALNLLGVHCACVGNHDFDFGVQNLETLVKQCSFPWLLSNIFDKASGRPLGDVQTSHMLQWQGVTVGIIGLAELDWIATLAAVKPEEVDYRDFVAEGSRLAAELRAKGADLVIALTHSRRPNDIICARELTGVDIILGGHDHDHSLDAVQRADGRTVHVVKSGTDFRELSLITLQVPCQDLMQQAGVEGGGHGPPPLRVDVERVEVPRDGPADPGMQEIARRYGDIMGQKLQKVIGETATDLDGRFSTDLMAILPMLDATVVIRASGRDVVAALENGVSQYPKLEGRFLQVSGVKFRFDPSKPPGHRIDANDVWVTKEDECARIDLDAFYAVATKLYMTSGKDGFDCLQGREVIVDEEHGPTLPTIAVNVFSQLRTLNLMTSKEQKVRRAALKWQASLDKKSHANVLSDNVSYVSIKHPVQGNYVIAPKCDGRIICVQ
ncbi:hypothetical protein WJX73_008626 [Symbiochloris irregularis]|uniref:5'-nucleotidase n=1 Tax=Symbiochloris irregularis TaxID=706552 RepID=A0AAW1NQU8_9CHLO